MLHLIDLLWAVVKCCPVSCKIYSPVREWMCVCGKDSMSTAGLCSNRQQSRNECRHCEPQSDWSHLVRFSSIILYFRFSHCLYTFTRRRVHRETPSFLWGLIMNTQLYQTSLYLSLCVCVFLPPQFHNLQELRHSASLANKVFIQRDYSEGTTCKFQTKFPSELESRVSVCMCVWEGKNLRATRDRRFMSIFLFVNATNVLCETQIQS